MKQGWLFTSWWWFGVLNPRLLGRCVFVCSWALAKCGPLSQSINQSENRSIKSTKQKTKMFSCVHAHKYSHRSKQSSLDFLCSEWKYKYDYQAKIRKNLICKLIARSVMCRPHARNINGQLKPYWRLDTKATKLLSTLFWFLILIFFFQFTTKTKYDFVDNLSVQKHSFCIKDKDSMCKL